MLRRKLLTAGCAAAVVLMLSGCGIGVGQTDSGAKVAGCEIPEANRGTGPIDGKADGQITFETLGLKASFGGFFTKQIARFEKAHPGVKIKWIDDPGGADYQTRLATDIKICKLPDVINVDIQGTAALANVGLTMNMADRLPEVKKNYVPGIWKSAQKPGTDEIAALPWYTGVDGLMYNKTLMKKFGISKMPTTFDEYFDTLSTIASKADGKYYGDWGNQLYALPKAFAYQGVHMMNADHTAFTFASDKTAVKWVTNLAKAYKEGAFPPDSISGEPNASQAYTAGQLVMGSAQLRTVKADAPDIYKNSGVAPYMFDKLGGPLVNGQYITVPKTSKNAATALAFAKFVTSVPEQDAWCSKNGVQPIPAMATLPADSTCWSDPTYDSLFKQYMHLQRDGLQKAKSDPIIWYWTGGVSAVVVPQIQLAMQGQVTPEAALKTAQDAANKVLATVGSK